MDDWFGHWPEWLFVALAILGGSSPVLLGLPLLPTVLLAPVGCLLGVGSWLVVMVLTYWLWARRNQQ